MEQDRHLLEQEIANTTQSLRLKIEKLEEKTQEAVTSVADGVKLTAKTIQKGAQSFSLKHQMEVRPGVVVATAVGAGVVTGLRAGRGRRHSRSTSAPAGAPATRLAFAAQAAEILLPLALKLGTHFLAEWAKKKHPKSKPYVELLQTAVDDRS